MLSPKPGLGQSFHYARVETVFRVCSYRRLRARHALRPLDSPSDTYIAIGLSRYLLVSTSRRAVVSPGPALFYLGSVCFCAPRVHMRNPSAGSSPLFGCILMAFWLLWCGRHSVLGHLTPSRTSRALPYLFWAAFAGLAFQYRPLKRAAYPSYSLTAGKFLGSA